MKSNYFDAKRSILSRWSKEQLLNIIKITKDTELIWIARNYLRRKKIEDKWGIKIEG